MSKGGAATTVILAGGVLTALALIPAEGNSGSAYKKLWAAGLLTAALGVAADFVPEIVGPFAVLIIIAAVVRNPGVIGKFVAGTAPTAGSSTTVQKGPPGTQWPVGSSTSAPTGLRGPTG